MKAILLKSILTVFVILFGVAPTKKQPMDFVPDSWDYGVVEVGDFASALFSLENNNGSIQIYDAWIEGSSSFSIVDISPALPVLTGHGDAVLFEVSFQPAESGVVTGKLFVDSSDALYEVDLAGEGANAPSVCINTIVDNLNAYIDGLSISSSRKRAITRRLSLTASKFCSGYSTSSAISTLDNVASYVEYQSGSGIPAGDADYIIAQVNGLIGALNAGTADCCPTAAARPANPGQATAMESYELAVNPNPFRQEVSIRFYLPKKGAATLEVLHLNGQRVRFLESAPFDAGRHERVWDCKADGGQGVAPGVYLLRLQTQDQAIVKKLMLVR